LRLLAEPAGRLLERTGNCAPRGMTVHDRTRLIGQLLFLFRDFTVAGFILRQHQDRVQKSKSDE
jgi:hypothetical protein